MKKHEPDPIVSLPRFSVVRDLEPYDGTPGWSVYDSKLKRKVDGWHRYFTSAQATARLLNEQEPTNKSQ